MVPGNSGYRGSATWFGLLAIILPLGLAALACNIQVPQNDGLRQTDIALSVQQTLLAQTASALSVQGSKPTAAVQVASATPALTATPAIVEVADKPTEIPPTTAPLPSNTPLAPSATPLSFVSVDKFKLYQFSEASSGCTNAAKKCWLQNMSGAGSWKTGKPVEGSLTSVEPVTIDSTWARPYLVFSHKLTLSHFTAYLQIKVSGNTIHARTYENSSNWGTEAIDLSPYKGKPVQVVFYSNLTSFLRSATSLMRIEWIIQDVKIVPNYSN